MKIKKLASSLVVLTLVSGMITGCSSSNSKEGEASGEVKILTAVSGGKDDAEMKLFEEKLEELTGLEITLIRPASDYDNVVMQKLQSDEGIDLFYTGSNKLPYLVEQGAVLDITDKVKESEVLSDTSIIPESEWNDIKIDEKIYAGFNKKELHRVVNVNEAIAKSAGVEVSSIEPTLDSYYNLFKSMKDKNTTKGFYPFNSVISEIYDLQPWFASAGLKGGIVLDESGKKTVPWSTDESAVVWEWLNKLYSEGLMDPNALTDTTKELRSKFQSGMTGCAVDWAAWTGLYNATAGEKYPESYRVTPLPGTKTGDSNYMLTRGGASLWAIPADSDNVDGAIKVIEAFATQEGGELLSVGIEGNDYEKKDGKYAQTETGIAHGNDHGAPVPISSKFVHPIGYNPGFEEAMGYLQYATIETSLPETDKHKEIMGRHAVKIVKGDVEVSKGLEDMRNELKEYGVID